MEENHIHIYLKLYEFELQPYEITNMLGLKPTGYGIKGETFFIGNKTKKLEREYKSNWWEYQETHITETKWQQNYVDEFIKRVVIPRVEIIKKITSEGAGELALAPHYYGEWNLGFDFNLDTLKALTESGLVLDMDIYCFERG